MSSLPLNHSVRGPPTVLTCSNEIQLISFTSQSSYSKESVSLCCWFQASLLFCIVFICCWHKFQSNAHLIVCDCCRVRWLGPRMSYFPKTAKRRQQLAGRYVLHVRKQKASKAPRTHFRAYKISKFPGGVPPTPPHTILLWAPLFVFALGLQLLSDPFTWRVGPGYVTMGPPCIMW